MKRVAIVYLSLTLLATSILSLTISHGINVTTVAPNITLDDHFEQKPFYLVLAAEIALMHQKVETALTYYEKAALISQDPDIFSKATELAVQLGKQEAYSLAQQWASLAPFDPLPQIIAFNLLMMQDKSHAAYSYLQKALTIAPAHLSKEILTLYPLLPKNQQESMQTLVQKLIQDHPKQAYPLLISAQLYNLEEEFNHALASVNQALYLSPDLTPALQLKAELIGYQLHDKKASLLFLAKKIKIFPEKIELKLLYANLLLEHQKPKEAILFLKPIVKQAKSKELATLLLAESYSQTSQFAAAVTLLETLIDNPTYQYSARYLLGDIFAKQDQFEAAISWYLSVIDGPYHMPAYLKTVDFYIKQKSYEQAMEIVEKINPTDLEEQKLLALIKSDLLIEMRHFNEALSLSDQLLTEFSKDTDILYNHALAALGLGQMLLVEYDLKQILEINHHHLYALNTLGFILLNSNRITEAQIYLTKAMEIAPNDPAVLDSMGWLHYRLGHLNQAENFLKKAHYLSQNSDISAHLGEVLWMRGNTKQASLILQKALSQNPSHPELLKTISRLKNQNNAL